MWGTWANSRRRGVGMVRLRYYEHQRPLREGAKRCPRVRADELEELVLAEVARALAGPNGRDTPGNSRLSDALEWVVGS